MYILAVLSLTPQSFTTGHTNLPFYEYTGEGDSLRWARICRPTEEVLVATRDGFGESVP
jgi:hypothetical protein